MRKVLRLTMLALLSLFLVSCNQGTKQTVQVETGDQARVVKKKREDGTLSSLNPLDEEGYVHGVKVNF